MATRKLRRRETWLTIAGAARRLRRRRRPIRISPSTLRRYTDLGIIAGRRLPGKGSWRRVLWSSVLDAARYYFR